MITLSKIVAPRPNLLVNSDYRSNIINQRGQSSYSNLKDYDICIDKWRLSGNLNTFPYMSVYDNYIVVSIPKDCSFNQYLHYPIEESKQYTFHINYKRNYDETIYDQSVVVTSGDTTGTKLFNDVYVVLRNYADEGNYKYQLYIGNRGSSIEMITIYYSKLEIGTAYTGMDKYNYTAERSICQMYQLYGDIICQLEGNTGGGVFNFLAPIPQQFIETPKLFIEDDPDVFTKFDGITIRDHHGKIMDIMYDGDPDAIVRVNFMFSGYIRLVVQTQIDIFDYVSTTDPYLLVIRGKNGFYTGY